MSANQLPSLQLPKRSGCAGGYYDFFEVSVFLMKEKEIVVSGICSFVVGRKTIMNYKASICFPIFLYLKKLEF